MYFPLKQAPRSERRLVRLAEGETMRIRANWLLGAIVVAVVLITTACPMLSPPTDDQTDDQSDDQPATNRDPVLSEAAVTPMSGTESTEFTFTVTYTDEDGDAPDAIEVCVDGTAHAMTLQSGAAHNGTYELKMAFLSIGAHACYFVCSDGQGGSARLPTTGAMNAPTVSAPNTAPELANPAFSPATGDVGTVFTFSVDYFDADGDAPATIDAVIDGVANAMTLVSGIDADGGYAFSGTLSSGANDYYVVCTDGYGGQDRIPAAGTLTGPTVSGRTLSGTVTYSGAETVTAAQPLRVDVWADASTPLDAEVFTSVQAQYDFSFELDPGSYAVSAAVDMDASADLSEGDVFIFYDGTFDLDDPTLVDVTTGGQSIVIDLDDSNFLGFFEDFDDGVADDWLEDPDALWSVSNGDYVMTGIESDDVAVAAYDLDSVADFTFHCDSLEQLGGSEAAADWGILLRFDPVTQSGYTVTLEDGPIWVVYRISSISGTPLAWGAFAERSSITVDFRGSDMELYIDGVLTWTGADTTYTNGYVGFYAWDDDLGGAGPQQYAFGDTWLVLH
jgi:hypothetical protein